MRLFFYGTLLDPDIQSLVLGRVLDERDCAPAELRHFRRVYIAGRRYPMLLPHRGGSVIGAVAGRLGRDDRARLCCYEGEGYRLERHGVFTIDNAGGVSGQAVASWLFRSRSATRWSMRDWQLDVWQARDKAAYVREVRDWLASFPSGAIAERSR